MTIKNDERIIELRITPSKGDVAIRQLFGKDLTDAELIAAIETAMIQASRIAHIDPLLLISAFTSDVSDVAHGHEKWDIDDD